MENFSFSQIGNVDLGIAAHRQGRVWRYEKLVTLYPMHHHQELEINLVLHGTGSYLLGNQRYMLEKHALVWLFPGQDHILLEASDDLAMWSVVCKPELLQWACRTPETSVLREPCPEGHFRKRLGGHEAERLAALFHELASREGETDYFNTGLAFALITAWTLYLAAGQEFAGRLLHPAVEKAVRIISEETMPLTLEAIAAQVGLCPAHLSSLFKRETGLSLLHFRNTQRVERFLYLCQRVEKPNLLEIALEAGFGSYAQFHRVFKQLTGRSPSHKANDEAEQFAVL